MTKQGQKTKLFDEVSELYNNFLEKYFYEYYDLLSEKKKSLDLNICLFNLKLKGTTIVDFIMKHWIKIMVIIILMKIMVILMNSLIFQICHHQKVMKKK